MCIISLLKIIEVKHNTCSRISNKLRGSEYFFTFTLVRKTCVQVKKCLLFKLFILFGNYDCMNGMINYIYNYNDHIYCSECFKQSYIVGNSFRILFSSRNSLVSKLEIFFTEIYNISVFITIFTDFIYFVLKQNPESNLCIKLFFIIIVIKLDKIIIAIFIFKIFKNSIKIINEFIIRITSDFKLDFSLSSASDKTGIVNNSGSSL